MEHTTKGTIFYYYTKETTPQATQIYGMMTKPALPGLPNQVEATSQEDLHQKFADGVEQYTDANFQFKYAALGTTSNYNIDTFMEQEEAGVHYKYGVKYPHGKCVEFEAKPFVQYDATNVNALDTFTVAMREVKNVEKNATAPATIVVPAPPPAGGGGG
ncbi:MAG: hypothetical protein ACOX3P_03925 [Saccharofermentanales bacterium]|mgnify:CR=1 FL=1|jgi:hypothetical protein|nr:hypothetical protein [Bacillota bacterium]NLB08150.1 hypothetical protein [Clostridiales bacterium]